MLLKGVIQVIRRLLFFQLVAVCVTPVLHAEVLEIPVAEFEGSYSSGSNIRYYQLDLGTHITAVNEAWLELTATITFGTGHGDGVEIPLDEWFDWSAGFISMMPEPEQGFMWAPFSSLEGQTVQLRQYESFAGATWDFLLDGTGEIFLEFSPMASIGGVMVESPTATVESARLIIDILHEPIAAGESSWGHIKALMQAGG